MEKRLMTIGNKKIGGNYPSYIVAEISANHLQNFKRALAIIDAAYEAKADAIKLQTYTPDTMTVNSKKKWFQITGKNTWSGYNLYQLYQEADTPWEWQPKLKKYAEKKGLELFSTPFDETAVDFLETMKVNVYKIASFEVTDIPLLEKIAKTRKPIIMSRGMANLKEIQMAIKTLKANGAGQIAILHCTSAYPSPYKEMNLKTIADLSKRFKVVSGLSDHSLGIEVPVAAISLGAKIIEKHITLSRKDGGPDAQFSLEPDEFKTMIQAIRHVEEAIGKVKYGQAGKEENKNRQFRRSIWAVKDINKDEKLTKENIKVLRPAIGLEPIYFKKVLGKRVTKRITKGTPITDKIINLKIKILGI